jgi:hypothetical protein
VVALTCVDEGPHRLGSVATRIDYVLAHMGYMESHKLSSFDSH